MKFSFDFKMFSIFGHLMEKNHGPAFFCHQKFDHKSNTKDSLRSRRMEDLLKR